MDKKKLAKELVGLAKALISTTGTFECPECGTKVLKNTGYCVKCKKKVKEAAMGTFECPKCGTKVLKNTGYCVKCKQKVKEASECVCPTCGQKKATDDKDIAKETEKYMKEEPKPEANKATDVIDKETKAIIKEEPKPEPNKATQKIEQEAAKITKDEPKAASEKAQEEVEEVPADDGEVEIASALMSLAKELLEDEEK